MDRSSLHEFLYQAYQRNMTNGEYVFLVADIQENNVLSDEEITIAGTHKKESPPVRYYGQYVTKMISSMMKHHDKIYQALKKCFFLAMWLWDPQRFDAFLEETKKITKKLLKCPSNASGPENISCTVLELFPVSNFLK